MLSLLVVMLISRAGQDMNAACPKLLRQQRCFSQPKAAPVKQLRADPGLYWIFFSYIEFKSVASRLSSSLEG